MKLSCGATAVALFSSLSLAAPSVDQKRALLPTVPGTAPKASYVGITTGTVESFKGIPFAQSVAGKNRLTAPKAITKPLGTVTAAANGPMCPSQSMVNAPSIPSLMMKSPAYAAAAAGNSSDEDCLTLNVQRPSGTTSKSKLPVVFWIYGGGFEAGSTNTYDATELITTSIAQKEPIVYVAVNYRLSAFGFLAGKELKNVGASNLGLLDQRLGLEWTADNIEAFGGDPSKVTIWGESAGAISVFDQMALYDGNNKYNGKSLFRGAIMNSGSIIPAQPVDGPKGQAVYDGVVAAAGCKGAANTVNCLRNVSYDKFMQASSSQPGIFSYSSVALAYLPRPDGRTLTQSPEVLVMQGKYAKVPFIVGDLEDEGTLFSQVQTNVTTQAKLVDYLHNVFFPDIPRSTIRDLVLTYPNNPAAGSPFRTGAANEVHPQYKRLAAILGDLTFTLTRRVFLNLVQANAPSLPSWSYLADYLHGTPILGTFHGSDILQIYGTTPGPPSSTFQGYYISFFNHLNPNTAKPSNLPNWPMWKNGKQLLHINALTNDFIPDNFRNASYTFISDPSHNLRI